MSSIIHVYVNHRSKQECKTSIQISCTFHNIRINQFLPPPPRKKNKIVCTCCSLTLEIVVQSYYFVSVDYLWQLTNQLASRYNLFTGLECTGIHKSIYRTNDLPVSSYICCSLSESQTPTLLTYLHIIHTLKTYCQASPGRKLYWSENFSTTCSCSVTARTIPIKYF